MQSGGDHSRSMLQLHKKGGTINAEDQDSDTSSQDGGGNLK